ncbi:MAG: M23 family metallopeptidase [Patescibacteria group bacterium]
MKRFSFFCLILALPLSFLVGCAKEGAVSNPSPEEISDDLSSGMPMVRGAYMGIASPIGPGEDPDDWRGMSGIRTGGGTIDACGQTMNSHQGADYYARDISRIDGTTLDEHGVGRKVYAGFNGTVVKVGSGYGQGLQVVIYDPARHVALRYAHLQSTAVQKGQYVTARQYLGRIGNTSSGPHLHLVGYENIDHFDANGDPVIPTLCDSEYYACIVFFFC